MGRHAAARVFNRKYDLRPQRLELIGKVLVAEPQAVERAALGWTGRVDLAAGRLVAELAPLVHRLFQRGDRHHLAAQCATSAGSHGTLPPRVESGDEICAPRSISEEGTLAQPMRKTGTQEFGAAHPHGGQTRRAALTGSPSIVEPWSG